MPKPTPAGDNVTRLRHFRELAASCGTHTRSTYPDMFSERPRGEIPAFALLYARNGRNELLLSHTSDVLAALAQEELERDPGYCPKALVCLTTGERRDARMPVFFMAPAIPLPPLVGDVLDNDLADREGDDSRNLAQEAELERASDLIHSGAPVPEELYDVVADVIELDLADREGDDEPNPDNERLLAEAHNQLLGRAPSPTA
jgi:hypothetical protein